jgi:ribosomal protein L11 methyltransferase
MVLDITPVFEEDIMAKMKRDFPPLEVASFFIHTFDEEVPEGMTEIKVPAGIAFGTGEHPTTAGCLTLFDDVAESRTFKNGLDMGCGSAILSMAAAKRDNIPFLAVDIDAPSVGIAKDNCEANGVSSKISCIFGDCFKAEGVQENKGYDIIFANILANPLIEMSADLIDVMADDGVAILSGFLVDQRDDVLSAYEEKGLTLLEDITLGEWVAAALVKAKI